MIKPVLNVIYTVQLVMVLNQLNVTHAKLNTSNILFIILVPQFALLYIILTQYKISNHIIKLLLLLFTFKSVYKILNIQISILQINKKN